MIKDTAPTTFEGFIGQDRAKRILQILCQSAAKTGEPISHVLLNGPAGLGKTTLARILARQRGTECHEIIGSHIQHVDQLNAILVKLKAGDILFIDEVHQLPLHVEEVLYGPLGGDLIIQIAQAGYGDLMKAIGVQGKASMIKVEIQPFTLIGATTLAGHVSAPLRSRFNQVLQLEPYSVSDLQQIVSNAGKTMGFPLPQDVAHEIAARSRSTARTAMGNLKWYIEYSTATGEEPSMHSVHDAFDLKGIDRHGLNTLDHSYLRALVDGGGGPMGIGSLAVSIGESEQTLKESVEPFLLQAGFVQRAPRGRVATAKANEALEVAV